MCSSCYIWDVVIVMQYRQDMQGVRLLVLGESGKGDKKNMVDRKGQLWVS